MSHKIITQGTPNPNALKFIVAKDVKASGKISYVHPAECFHVPLAANLLGIPSVIQVHLFENVLTITKDDDGDWPLIEEKVLTVIQQDLSNHDPNFKTFEEQTRESLSPDMQRLEEILDRTIRPGLQADGGDIQVLEYKDHILRVKYEGACGNCPSSTTATLQGIEGILRFEFDPELIVEAI